MPDFPNFNPVKCSPLAGLSAPRGGIALQERPFGGKVNLRGNADDQAFVDAVNGVVNCSPPTVPNTVATSADYTVFWLGPDEWRIHCTEDVRYALITRLQGALAGQHAAVVDVSDYYVVMRLTGDKSVEVLNKGTPLDLHPRAFPVGRCAQTRFGHATVLLRKLEDNVLDLQVRWSFAEYVWLYIVDGTREYGD